MQLRYEGEQEDAFDQERETQIGRGHALPRPDAALETIPYRVSQPRRGTGRRILDLLPRGRRGANGGSGVGNDFDRVTGLSRPGKAGSFSLSSWIRSQPLPR